MTELIYTTHEEIYQMAALAYGDQPAEDFIAKHEATARFLFARAATSEAVVVPEIAARLTEECAALLEDIARDVIPDGFTVVMFPSHNGFVLAVMPTNEYVDGLSALSLANTSGAEKLTNDGVDISKPIDFGEL